ncbi:MAG: OB-fold nucleic acid binding domain-containing protein, partial [Enterococcus faecalis]|nr:OB-fold nucleic acid binding domain-containing protein [Enterococcus faecalis]
IYVKNIRTIRTKKGEQMAFVDGDDTTGSISLTLFPTVFRQLRQSVEKGQVYYVEGKVERSTYNQELQILVQRIEKAQQVETSISDETCFIRITKDVEQTDVFQKMKEVLSRHAGHIPVIVYFEKTGKKIVLNEENWVAHTSASQQQLAYVLGEQNVIFK